MEKTYNKEKIEMMKRRIFDEYNQDSIIERIVRVVPVDKTDGTFTQIGIRPLVDEDMLISPNYYSDLPMAGRIISVGERDHLIRKILDDGGVTHVQINENQFTPEELQKHIEHREQTLILPSDVQILMLKDDDWIRHIEFRGGQMRFNSMHNIIFVPNEVMPKKIIIVDEFSILWSKLKFLDKTTNKKEKLNIEIGTSHPNGKVDILIRSLNKIEFRDKSLIKIIEII